MKQLNMGFYNSGGSNGGISSPCQVSSIRYSQQCDRILALVSNFFIPLIKAFIFFFETFGRPYYHHAFFKCHLYFIQ